MEQRRDITARKAAVNVLAGPEQRLFTLLTRILGFLIWNLHERELTA